MTTVTDYLIQLQDLTKKNIEILQGINDSFFRKETHLKINVGNTDYIIPSYVALENKINALEENFINLVHAPKTGEAFFVFDGNSKAINVRGYNTTPPSIALKEPEHFNYETNNIFKDFLTPKPYITFDLSPLSNDINSVNVKKVIPINSDLKQLFISNLQDKNDESNKELASKSYTYADLYKVLKIYNKDTDYIEYDTIMKLPIRKNIGQGTYVIEKIVKDIVNDSLENLITLKLRSDFKNPSDKKLYSTKLYYKLFDETIEVPLSVGDELITYDGNAKVKITNIEFNTNTITVKVLNGDYVNFVESSIEDASKDDFISDYSKLRFYRNDDTNPVKDIKIPLEEDQYVFIAIAPLNDRMNIQSSWGTGVMLNTYKLTLENSKTTFNEYYKNNVNNIGDVLFELTAVATNGITKYAEKDFTNFTKYKPVINTDDIRVTQINKHLNDSDTVKNIKSLYSQKQVLNNELMEIQQNISNANETLSKINFDDTTGRRAELMSKISIWNKDKSEKVIAINKVINEISIAATNSDVPIENAKYRIRGYYDFSKLFETLPVTKDHILGIQVQYRYKNMNVAQGSAMSINDKFIFSDWNIMKSINNPRVASYKDGKYNFALKPTIDNANEPSCNQIDIPISQGETVDIKLKVVYDFGAPYIETTSDWSDIVNIEFPIEFTKDIQVLDIIKENNDDIETNRFNNILLDTGVTAHIEDKLVDQDLIYLHKPDSISSGFVTPERRIIPLKDKLIDMDRLITELTDIVKGSTSESLEISVINGENTNILYPWQTNSISVDAYNTFNTSPEADITSGTYNINGYVISTVLNISITNISNHIVKLYSIFPGPNEIINSLKTTKYDVNDYSWSSNYDRGVWIKNVNAIDNGNNEDLFIQTANQYVTFRVRLVNSDQLIYGDLIDPTVKPENKFIGPKLGGGKDIVKAAPDNVGMWVYPIVENNQYLLIDNMNNSLGKSINPGEQIIIPIMVEYNLNRDDVNIIQKTISFDLRTSLYTDPINYTFNIIAKKVDTIQDKVLSNNRKLINVKYKPSIK